MQGDMRFDLAHERGQRVHPARQSVESTVE